MRQINQLSTGLIGREPNYQAPKKQAVPDRVGKFVDRLFIRLKSIFPAWKQAFESDEFYNEAKRLWLEALLNNGITTAAQFQAGIAQAERSNSPFFPSVGQFIAWCNEGAYSGLPIPEELLTRYREFRASPCESAEAFKWQSAVEYHLVLQLKRAIYHGNLNEEKALIRAKTLIGEMDKYLRSGGTVSEPGTNKLPETVVIAISDEQRKQNFINLKAILKGQQA